MINEMFTKTQSEVPNLQFVVATLKEKPIDDILDYKHDLSDKYLLKLRKQKVPATAATRTTKRVRGKFEREMLRKN